MLYFKFTQSSHAVIFCTAVFVLPVSSHVVISRAFQGPPLKVRAHSPTSATPTPTPISHVNEATKPPEVSLQVVSSANFFFSRFLVLLSLNSSFVISPKAHVVFQHRNVGDAEQKWICTRRKEGCVSLDAVEADSGLFVFERPLIVMDEGLYFSRRLALIPHGDQGEFYGGRGGAD